MNLSCLKLSTFNRVCRTNTLSPAIRPAIKVLFNIRTLGGPLVTPCPRGGSPMANLHCLRHPGFLAEVRLSIPISKLLFISDSSTIRFATFGYFTLLTRLHLLFSEGSHFRIKLSSPRRIHSYTAGEAFLKVRSLQRRWLGKITEILGQGEVGHPRGEASLTEANNSTYRSEVWLK
jgi:hypothetical protein